MRHFIIAILIYLFSVPAFGQTLNDTLKGIGVKSITDSSHIKIIIRDGFQGEPSYYLNGKKIDLSKYFITANNIKKVSIVKSDKAKQLFGDTAKGGLVLITTKPNLKFLTLIELLKLNNLDYHELDPLSVEINDKQVLDTATLIDSKAKVFPIYKKKAGQKTAIIKKENIIGASIITNAQKRKKKYGR